MVRRKVTRGASKHCPHPSYLQSPLCSFERVTVSSVVAAMRETIAASPGICSKEEQRAAIRSLQSEGASGDDSFVH